MTHESHSALLQVQPYRELKCRVEQRRKEGVTGDRSLKATEIFTCLSAQ
jgi:hypothetical protein